MTRIMAQNVKLTPNAHMKHLIKMQCGYRRYCYNHGLSYWNDMYDAWKLNHNNPKPTARKVRQYLVHNKQDWQFTVSARVLQQAIRDLGKSFKAFFDQERPDAQHPKFYSKKRPKQSFKTDRARIVNGKLRLDRARGYDKAKFYDIPMEGFRPFSGKLLLVNVGQVKHQYIATLFYKNSEKQTTVYTSQNTAVDVNVGHFNFTKGVINILPKSVNKLYDQDKYYQNRLARKREVHPKLFKKSKSYQKVRIKLQRNYRRITNIQNDILHKFTHYLIVHFDRIVIENLDVRQMQMTHVASKGMQRSLFGRFRQFLAYKCKWYGKKLILASRWYPSTQICSRCGYRKVGNDKITLQGNQKHHTRHDQFICYHCGFRSDRDDNAVRNLLKLAD